MADTMALPWVRMQDSTGSGERHGHTNGTAMAFGGRQRRLHVETV
jgi:hypothetical protein